LIEKLINPLSIALFVKTSKKEVIKIEINEIELAVLKAMHSRLIYGKNHKKIETVMRSGFPSHLRKEVKKAILSLIKRGYILWYHRADNSIHLNKEKYDEIDEVARR